MSNKKSERWTYADRLAVVNQQYERLNKSKDAIVRRILKNEGPKLKQVEYIRNLWRDGYSLAKIKKIVGYAVHSVVYNLTFYNPDYDYKIRNVKRYNVNQEPDAKSNKAS